MSKANVFSTLEGISQEPSALHTYLGQELDIAEFPLSFSKAQMAEGDSMIDPTEQGSVSVIKYFRSHLTEIQACQYFVMPMQGFAAVNLLALIRMAAPKLTLLFPCHKEMGGKKTFKAIDLASWVGEESPIRKLRKDIIGGEGVNIFNASHLMSSEAVELAGGHEISNVKAQIDFKKSLDVLMMEAAHRIVAQINSEQLAWDGVGQIYNHAPLAFAAVVDCICFDRLTGNLPVVTSIRKKGEHFTLIEESDLQSIRAQGAQMRTDLINGNAPVTINRELLQRLIDGDEAAQEEASNLLK